MRPAKSEEFSVLNSDHVLLLVYVENRGLAIEPGCVGDLQTVVCEQASNRRDFVNLRRYRASNMSSSTHFLWGHQVMILNFGGVLPHR